MKKVIFTTHKQQEHIKVVAEYDYEATPEEINQDFYAWLLEMHDACWYIEGEK